MKKPKIQIPMSLIFAVEKCLQVLLGFIFHTDVSKVSGVVEDVENSDHTESSNGGV